jgi:hypothetical protein
MQRGPRHARSPWNDGVWTLTGYARAAQEPPQGQRREGQARGRLYMAQTPRPVTRSERSEWSGRDRSSDRGGERARGQARARGAAPQGGAECRTGSAGYELVAFLAAMRAEFRITGDSRCCWRAPGCGSVMPARCAGRTGTRDRGLVRVLRKQVHRRLGGPEPRLSAASSTPDRPLSALPPRPGV